MEKHKKLLDEKFSQAEEDLCYNSGGNVMWSLFRTKSGGVTIYYHETDDFYIISPEKAQHYSLYKIAESWEPITNTMIALK